ncbi:MAG: efflux RND transporter periplasmic adaptor subunit [Anaerolineales bacterium]|nr:efflux RND transporter periplasmic adaptor subunit [Anaerolineales bacterium]
MNKKSLTASALLLLFALLLMGCSAQGAEPDPGADLTPSPDLPPSNAVVADGRVIPVRSAELSLETGGAVSEILAAEGDSVKQGQPLVRLSSADQLTAAVASAQLQEIAARQELEALQDNASVATAQAMLDLANARDALKDAEYDWRVRQEGNRASKEVVLLAEANYLLAEKALDSAEGGYRAVSDHDKDDPDRAQALSDYVAAQNRRNDTSRNLNWLVGHPSEIDQAILDAELAEAQANVQVAEKAYEDVKDGVDPDGLELAQARLTQAEAQLRAAESALAQAELRAPFDGVVTAIDLREGEFVAPGIPVAWVADFSDWRVETTDLGEIDAVNVRLGDTATVTLDALPDVELAGTVESVSGFGETKQGDITYKAVLRLEPPYPDLLWNMTAYVTILPNLTASP